MIKSIFQEVKNKEQSIDYSQQKELMKAFVDQLPEDVNNILIIPPDYTRKHSGTGKLTAILYKLLKGRAEITIMPALGTHQAMTKRELQDMFGNEIPFNIFKEHNYIKDTVHIGEIPKEYISKVSNKVVNQSIDVKINKELVNEDYDLIVSIGQVLPHGVVGMSNYNKNILVGCGGREMIDVSHFIGAAYGMERLLGKDHSPVRKILDYAENKFLQNINISYILTVNTTEINPKTHLTNLLGIYIGKERNVFEKAVKASQKFNITYLDKPVQKMVVYMDKNEFKTTWLACKAIYRTRLVIEEGGELIVLAPGLKKFGENQNIDKLIRKYGYMGKKKILKYVNESKELKDNLAVAAHLIHGSTNGRFSVTFATDKLSKEELMNVNFKHMSYKKAKEIYMPTKLKYGYNKLNNLKIFFIENPATGLWMSKN